MQLRQWLLVCKLGLFYSCAFAINTNIHEYDNIPITSQTWQEVDLTYNNYINDKKYIEQANLLRPISWIKQNHLDKVGSTVHLTKEQLGVDTDVKVVAIKPISLNYSNNNYKAAKPVIATFITHINDIWDYTFKDQNGHTETISAVSGHSFYSADRQAFIPIGQFKIGEHVKTDNSSSMYLSGKHQDIKKDNTIYNFEDYQKHNYIIEWEHILVHNIEYCCTYCNYQTSDQGNFDRHMQTHTEEKPFPCTWPGCDYKAAQAEHLTKHMRTHTGDKPFPCTWPGCDYKATQNEHLTKHMRAHTGDKPFPCTWPGCDYKATQSSNLSKHMRAHTGDKRFECTLQGCGFKTPYKYSLTRHMQKQHGGARVIAEEEIPGTSAILDEALDLQGEQQLFAAAPELPPQPAEDPFFDDTGIYPVPQAAAVPELELPDELLDY